MFYDNVINFINNDFKVKQSSVADEVTEKSPSTQIKCYMIMLQML